jgi:hypothetical protein
MSQPSISQASDNNPYADLDMYGGNSNYMDQVANEYHQMNLGQVSSPLGPLNLEHGLLLSSCDA